MPTFSPFTYFGAFPKPAIQSSAPWLEDLGGTQSNSSIEEYKHSIPIWWLLYKLTLSVEVSMTTPVEISTTKSGIAQFDLVFTSDISPTSRFCRPSNIISGTGEAENVTTTGDWDSSGGVVDNAYFTLAPFQCERLHVNFYGSIQGMSSIEGEVYLTSSKNSYGFPDGGNLGADVENFYSSTLNITTPDGYTVDVYAYMNYYKYIDESTGDEWVNRCSGEVSIKDIEWWTPSG